MAEQWRLLRSKHALFILFFFVITITLSGPYVGYGLQVHRTKQSLPTQDKLSSTFRNTGFKRDDDEYVCSADKPCANGACCGSYEGTTVGVCGYGSTFCGDDCTSNCNATAPCGKDALFENTLCPLNVCCSQYGFCGTGELFCSNGCQNNCVLDPVPPSGGNKKGVLNRVIGYYEGWSNSRSCYAFPPSAIPTSGLTHVNFAFAYIDPDTFQIATMDSDMPTSLFVGTADIKSLTSGLSDVEIFISIGGWSFSDDLTTTQPVFSNIASSAANRKKFASNLVNFLKEYGFDGVDFDWEYPGAPDRGGKVEDTENYVLLLEAVREAFDNSDGSYGISFTAPSSYWYLQWFDLPGMILYADWINLMTYDLHGTWDSTDPIGSIVQAHTNLTEIKDSVELLWRVNVPPEKVVLGLGFYGRSFQLSDTSCGSPGCAFSGAAEAGTCTKSAGTLAYFEIMDIIDKQAPEVTWDKTDAVKYFQYGATKNQWVSYDDSDTFAQKVEWANGVGLGGVMIWSVDQDDTDFDALKGLIGKDIPKLSKLETTSTLVAGTWASQNGQDCQKTDCLSDSEVGSWGSDFAIAPNGGAFTDTCGKNKKKYIICPIDAMPSTCQWRGGETGRACHGQCHTNEVTLFHSKHASVNCLSPGQQSFCCESNTWSELVGSCDWSADDTCAEGKTWVAMRNTYDYGHEIDYSGSRTIQQAYCCDSSFDDCHWIGKGNCDDNECADYEIELCTDDYGNSTSLCASGWNGRSKVLCCTPPNSLNPFLPVPLANIFPTLPPSTDVPDFEIKPIQNSPTSSGSDTVSGAFSMVVIDGPADIVTSLSKRDDSHIEFLDCDSAEKRDPKLVYTVRYICMDDSPESNCDAVHQGGAEGTIVKLPEGCGFGTYGVVSAIRLSNNLTVEHELRQRTPSPNPPVYEMDIKYDYTLVKRDSGTVYVRIDYDNTRGMNESINKRFWSADEADWKTGFDAIRNLGLPNAYTLNLEEDDIYQLLYSGDVTGSCGEDDGWLNIELEGSVASKLRWGVTMVGTISPEISFEETYGFFDVDMDLSGTIMLDGKASINVGGSTKPASVFDTDISNFAFSEPGIVSFTPKMNILASMTGQGTIDSDFRLSFRAGTDGYARTNAPLSLGDLSGDIENVVGPECWTGFAGGSPVSTGQRLSERDSSSSVTLLGLLLSMRTWLEIDVYNMGTSTKGATAEFAVDVPHYIRIVSDSGNTISVIGGDQQVGVEVYSSGISSKWEQDDTSHLVGSVGSPYVFTNGTSNDAPLRTAPNWGSGAVITGDFVGCSGNSSTKIVCYQTSNMSDFDPDWLIDPETGDVIADEKRRRGYSNDSLVPTQKKHFLLPRPYGAPRKFTVKTPTSTFVIESHRYPNQQGGAFLLSVNPEAGYYWLENPEDCEDPSFTNAGDPNGAKWVTEHVVELSTFKMLLEWMMGGQFQDIDGNPMTTDFSTVDEALLGPEGPFQQAWDSWSSTISETTPIDDIWRAFGDDTNPSVLVNAESVFNGIKLQVWQGNNPMSDSTWNTRNFNDASEGTGSLAAQRGMSTIRAATAIFNYLNSQVVNENLATVLNNIHEIFSNFDDAINEDRADDDEINTARLFREFIFYALIKRLEGVQQWADRRLRAMIREWEAELARPTSSARAIEISNVLVQLRGLLSTVEDVILIDTSRFNFEIPDPSSK
ncbi:hypothetical protein BGAL_0003g00830 [Botrytis galanthina]|uniref:chitinase n=1 Tax=Botrytis galanthina TaxID=278940 RepID=A0A4S8REE4_9HELO|nr:hypothetical protein BGAL_0003g00830 [Botrytis galanthina]